MKKNSSDWFEDIVDELKGAKITGTLSWEATGPVYIELDGRETVYAKLENKDAILKMRAETNDIIDPEVFRKYQKKD